MTTGPYIIYGHFKGLFKTKQDGPLGNADNPPTDNHHTVQVYQGTFNAEEFSSEFSPENYRKLNSFVLSNVPNIAVNAGSNGPYVGSQIYTFTQLILIDPKIIRTTEIEGQTYGEIESIAYGKTYVSPQLKKLKPDPFDKTGYSENEQWYRTNSGCLNSGVNGCGTIFQGCLANFWRIFWLLLSLLLLLAFVRKCNDISNDDKACIESALKKKDLLEKEKELKKTNEQYNQNLKNALANVSKIYFYRNSTELHLNSTGVNGTLDRLVKVIKTYDDKVFILEGHRDIPSIENENIDLKRAQRVQAILESKGITKDKLIVIRRTDKYAQPLTLDKMMVAKGIREYNQNMKVTIRVKKQKSNVRSTN